jgi:hypothetical protein
MDTKFYIAGRHIYPFDLKSLVVHDEILIFSIRTISRKQKEKPKCGRPFGTWMPFLNESQLSILRKLENGAH